MPNKTEEYLALAQRTANGLTRYWEHWTDYLTTASRLYKYSFADQLMIYAQRPDATACADYNIWNNRMNRYVRRGSKGIALLDQSSSVPRLHYVFDVSDTGVRRNSRDPEMWQLNDDLFQPISEMLAREYGIYHERLSQQIADIAGKLAESYWDNNSSDLLAIVDGTFLMDYDEAGQALQFKSAAAISIMYTILERCGFEPEGHFDRGDFQAIYDFSTPDAVYALGTAVSDCSRDVLRNIERTVKTTIRRRNVERSQHEYEEQERDLLDRRGLPAPEPDFEPAAEAAGQVRTDAPELPDGASPGAVQLDASDREAASASAGSGAGGGEPEAADDDRTAESEPRPGQSAEPTGVGAAHEQPEGTGGRSDPDGTDLQLSFFNLSIPTEAQQIEAIDRAENEKSSSAFVLSQAEIEHELRKHGSGFQDGKQRIIELYQTQPDKKLRAKALAKEYGIGGHSHDYLDGSSGFVNHDGKGLEFVRYPDYQKITLSWTQAEKYIDLMIHSDRYLTDTEKKQRAARQEAERQLPMLDGTIAAEYTALKEQYPNTLVGFELNGNYLFYDKDATTVERILHTRLLSQENALGKVKVTGFPRELWVTESKKLWAEGNNVYLAGLNEDGSHHQTKYLREADYLPIGSIIKLDNRDFRVEHVNFMFKSVSLQDMELTKNGLPIFRHENLPRIRELYEEQQDAIIDAVPDKEVSYKIGDEVVVDLPTRTIEGTVGYIGDTDVRIDTSAHGQSWDNEVINKLQFENLPVPDAKFETVVVKPSETQKAMVQELSRRAAEIHSGNVDASVDNMLCVTNDGRKIGLDVRLMNPMLPDDPDSKLNVCVRNVLKIWEEGKDQKLTQLLFCDLSTPKNDGNFNVYDDIRKKLIAAGVPENEIEFIHNADTEAKKAALFSKVRSGDVRVLLGSTAKMGAGTNVQQRLVAVHHLDVGWKPSDMTQRNGRIIRQGNMNKEVKVFNYVTEGTFDSYLFQTLENKQRFISQIMTSKSPVRSCDDVDEQALSYAEIKALCAGNPLIKEKMDLDVQVSKLKVLKADHQSQKFRLEDKLLTKFPAEIQEQTAKIAALKSDAEIATAHPQDKENFSGMVIKGMTYDEKKTAGERLILACMELPNTEEQLVGSYRGFELSLRFDTFHKEHQALLKGTLKYPVPLGSDPHGNIVRLDNALSNFADRITVAENELDTLKQQQAAAQVEVAKPFPQEEELAQKSARLAELNAQLDVDEKHHEPEQDEEEKEDAPRRSVLAALEEKAEKTESVKPFKSYLDKDGDAR